MKSPSRRSTDPLGQWPSIPAASRIILESDVFEDARKQWDRAPDDVVSTWRQAAHH